MGKKGGSSSEKAAARASAMMAMMAKDYYDETEPIRSGVLERYNTMMEDPEQIDISQVSPMWKPAKIAAEDAFSNATNNIVSTMPQGGQMFEALNDASLDTAKYLTGAAANIMQDEYNKAYGLASMSPQVAFSGLGQAGQIAGQSANAEAQRNAGKMGAMGSLGRGLGSFLGGKI